GIVEHLEDAPQHLSRKLPQGAGRALRREQNVDDRTCLTRAELGKHLGNVGWVETIDQPLDTTLGPGSEQLAQHLCANLRGGQQSSRKRSMTGRTRVRS